MAITYVHPSISSTITDNSATFVTASGTTKLYAVFTSAKGEDNKIKMITSASEYIFNYGEPNMKKYGQINYNIINWLNAGGVVYCLRVLPENAGYANAIVNIQTKVTKKYVLDVNDELVEVPNVTLRPVVTYTSVNNNSKSAIEIDELRRSTNKETIDGFTNNMLFAVIPNGRGEGYNNLGFRIYLTDKYDSTYDFRLYNFEVTQVSSSGSTDVIEGPFTVSLDPDALSLSNDSLFITNVVNKYSNHVKVIFNEDNYNKLGEIINPNVNPAIIDFFNGVTRRIDDVPETYYDEVTGKDEDIHMSVIDYANDGTATSGKNIIDPENEIEGAIVQIDNTNRIDEYNQYINKLDVMKVALSKVRKSTPSSNVLASYLSNDINAVRNESELDVVIDDLSVATSDLVDTTNERNYITYNEALNNAEDVIDKLKDKLYYIYNNASIMPITSSHVEVLNALNSIDNKLSIMDSYMLKFTNMLSEMVNFEAEYANVSLDSTVSSDKEEFIENLISSGYEIINLLTQLNSTSNEVFANTSINNLTTDLATIAGKYTALKADYITDEDYNETMVEALAASNVFITNAPFTIKLGSIAVESKYVKEILTLLRNTKSLVLNLADALVNSVSTLNIDDIVTNINLFESQVNVKKQGTFKNILQNYNSNIKLLFGSDGDITDKICTSKEVESLISKGYKGLIDESVLDKRLYPIDVLLDANYSVNIKNALITLATEIRDDFIAILDTKFQATPEQAIAFRRGSLPVSNFRVSIFAQDFVINDTDYTGNNIQVTPTYFLASKIPTNDNENGIHINFVGPRRGTISGFENISYIPNPEWKEQMYKAQLNYIEQDTESTRFGSQLTSQSVVSALSNINNVRTLLRIQRDVENLMKNYQFEYNDSVTISSAQLALTGYLSQWTTNRACTSISGNVYASAYDKLEKLLRVKVEMVFNSIIERIAIDLIVNN